MKRNAHVIFSVPPKEGLPSVTDRYGCVNVSQRAIAVHGKCRVVAESDEFWGQNSAPYRGPVLENPTYGRLLGQLAAQIRKTQDHHHIYLEGFYVAPKQPEAGVLHIRLSLGS